MDPPYPKKWAKQFSDMLISVINGLSVTDNEVLEKKIMSSSVIATYQFGDVGLVEMLKAGFHKQYFT